MSNALTWILSVVQSFFGLFSSVKILNVPLYAYLVFAFVMSAIAKFIHGKR